MKIRILLFLILLSITVNAQKFDTLKQFIKRDVFVISVEQKLDLVTAYGYQKNADNLSEHLIKLKKGQVFAIWNSPGRPTLSIITIPFKVRPRQDPTPQTVSTGLSNAGVALNFYNKRLDRYFANGKKATHNFGIGAFIAPSGEDIKSANTNGNVTTEVKQLFVSTGLVFSYTYNDLTFAFVPAGWDLATTDEGKDWIYNKKRWWGFGIGISTKLLGF